MKGVIFKVGSAAHMDHQTNSSQSTGGHTEPNLCASHSAAAPHRKVQTHQNGHAGEEATQLASGTFTMYMW